MSVRLVIAEKPSVAGDIAKALTAAGERFDRHPWGYESDRTLISSALGHLVAEVDPDEYDERYKTWRLEDLPILPDPFRYKPRDGKSRDVLRVLKSLMDRPDVSVVINSCDSGREGESIFKLVAQACDLRKPVLRAWFSSMTVDAIQTAFANLRPDAEMLPLEAAARSRSEADWLVGINATRAATVRLSRRELLSVGRVQTPTLALVAERDHAIETFVVEDYFVVRGRFAVAAGVFTASWFRDSAGDVVDRLSDRAAADELVARCTGRPARIASVEAKVETQAPPRLFDLTSLQQEANRRYGFTAQRTLAAAQKLYEEYKVCTYPRTDSQYLTADMAGTLPSVLRRVAAADPALNAVASALASGTLDTSRVVNDAKVADHHAIIPTDAAHDLSALDEDSRRLYDMVARRFVAALSGPAKVDKTVITVAVDTTTGDETFRARGAVVVEEGWRAVYPGPGIGRPAKDSDDGDATDEDQGTLPKAATGEPATGEQLEVVIRQTAPPKPFNDATLLGAMATAGRLVDDDELAEAMKESGLGTPATRAAIIERLLKVNYLERKGKALRATTKGRSLITALGDHPLTSPVLTGGWEKRLAEMERADPADANDLRRRFVADVRDFTRQAVEWLASLDATGFTTSTVLGPCPVPGCGGSVIERQKSWSCDSWKSKDEPGCGYAIWKTEGTKRVTEAQARARLTEPYVPRQRVERVELAPCPSEGCSGTVLVRAKSYSCDSWKSPTQTGCGFVIWRTTRDGAEVDEMQARSMIAEGRSDARPPRETLGACPMPRCKGHVVERARSFGCDSWKGKDKPGCGLTVWKTDKAGAELVTRATLPAALEDAVRAAAERKQARKK